jgi:thiol:disulfide interchange protein DsbD
MTELVTALKAALESGSAIAYILVFLGGILTSFEPCIYTMLPITIGFISSHSSGSKMRSFLLSVTYVLGIALTYSALGVVAALTGGLFGQTASNPWINLAMGNICILLGLSMFDIYTIKMPAFIMRLQNKRIGKGFVTIFFLGIFSGFVAGPCTAAVLFVALGYVAKSQSIFTGFSLLFTFSIGMGLILIVLGTFTGLLLSLPKAGPWMLRIRKIMGFVLIIIGEYFLFLTGKYWQ